MTMANSFYRFRMTGPCSAWIRRRWRRPRGHNDRLLFPPHPDL